MDVPAARENGPLFVSLARGEPERAGAGGAGRRRGVLWLKFRHGIPVAFGHMGHAAFWVVSAFDSNGIIEGTPQPAVR